MTKKIAIITGGSRGLGKNTAVHLARKGINIIFTYNSHKEEANKVIEEIKLLGAQAIALQLDVSQFSQYDRFVNEVKIALKTNWARNDFDYLVNNAGTGLYKPFLETTEKEFDDLFNIHLKATYFISQKLVPILKDEGKIINISSGLARFSFPGSSAYAAMKGGIEVLTRYMAKELGNRKISVNTIAPGAIETDFGGGRVRDDKELNKNIAAMTALGRVGLPDDIGEAITSILIQDSNWINAQRIEVSGGMLI